MNHDCTELARLVTTTNSLASNYSCHASDKRFRIQRHEQPKVVEGGRRHDKLPMQLERLESSKRIRWPFGTQGDKCMNLWTGILMLAIAGILIFIGRPDKTDEHPRFLRFNAALVLYP